MQKQQLQSIVQLPERCFAKKQKTKVSKEREDKQKEQIEKEFSNISLDDIKRDHIEKQMRIIAITQENIQKIKTGRASPTIFNDLEVIAYKEKQKFQDLAQTIVLGSNQLQIKPFDDAVTDDIMKALSKCDFEIQATIEGKNINVKLGASKKEHQQAALKQLKGFEQEFKQLIRDARHEISKTYKKIEKVIGKEETKLFERDINKIQDNAEKEGEKLLKAKEAELKKG